MITPAQHSATDSQSRGVPAQIGSMFPALIFVSVACGIGTGVAGILATIENMFFIPVLIFCLLVPIGFSIGLGTLALAASCGSRRAFYATWVLSGLMLLPTAGFLGIVIHDWHDLRYFFSMGGVPIGFSIGLGTLALAAIRGSRRAFHATWVLSGLMLLFTAGFLGIVIHDWHGLRDFFSMGVPEALGWVLLASCFVSLLGAFINGFSVRSRLKTSVCNG